MRKIFFALLIILLCCNIYAQNTKGNSSVGLFIGGAFNDNSHAVIGVDYRYNITDNIRLAPSVSYFIEANNSSAWNIDVNAQYLFPLSEKFSFYPLAGVSLSFWDLAYVDSRVGANIGLGGEFYATSKIVLGLDVKYNIIKDVDHAFAAVRVGYMF